MNDHGMKTRVTSMDEARRSLEPTGEECLVQIYGKQLGRRFPLVKSSVLIGRANEADIMVDSDTVSRHHAQIERPPVGGLRAIDLQSTNGTFINDQQIKASPLRNGDFLRIGDTIFKFLSGNNIELKYHEEIYRMTIQDGLTQIHNKRYLNEFLEREFSRSRRHGRDLSVVMFDLDHFKEVNDRYGHLSGDSVLQELAAVIKPRIRREELLARAGGEEFVVVLPESDLETARQYAGYIRAMIEKHEFICDGQKIPVTISLGVATLNDNMTRPDELVRAADQALYRAKNAGRNCVSI